MHTMNHQQVKQRDKYQKYLKLTDYCNECAITQSMIRTDIHMVTYQYSGIKFTDKSIELPAPLQVGTRLE